MVEKSENSCNTTAMDDNENYLELSKMNFSPFTTQFANVNVNQFAKFAQTLSAPSQVLSLVSGSDGNVQFLQAQPPTITAPPTPAINPTQTYITLPITIPPSKPGDASQTFQIQVLNPNPVPQPPKFQIPISLQQHGTTVLTVAYSPQDGELVPNQMPDASGGGGPLTVLAAIQPQDLQLLAQQNGLASAQQQIQALQHQQQQLQAVADAIQQRTEEENLEKERRTINIKTEPTAFWNQPVSLAAAAATQNPPQIDLSEFLQSRNITMQPYLKFNTEGLNIKKEIFTSDAVTQIQMNNNNDNNNVLSINNNNNNISSSSNFSDENSQNNLDNSEENVSGEKPEIDINGKVKKKRKMKKKPPKPKRPKPGQVHIATAIDGTILFCCPECQMAYPEKESLEQHLSVHKIERKHICDICGAGLKRKEHLERHKLGHNPERPYVCNVCLKGFKRKEHLNLHAVIHSGLKTEVCTECGKGFYRKDHLRKHVKSHLSKRMKEEANGGASVSSADAIINAVANGVASIKQERPSPLSSPPQKLNEEVTIAPVSTANSVNPPFTLPQEVTIHVQSNNTTLPVQINLPRLVATTTDGGEVVMKIQHS